MTAMVRFCCRQRGGFTLLEMVLTLAMSVLLMGIIGGAIQFYAQEISLRNLQVRQSHLAASIMQMIEDDLRTTGYWQPADLEPLEELFASVGGNGPASGDAGDGSAGSGNDATSGGEGNDGLEEEFDSESGVFAVDSAVLTRPGLIGSESQIQMDLSRLPRLEEYNRFVEPSGASLGDLPSDLKTVTYFVQPADTVGGITDRLAELTDDQDRGTRSGGLVRRVIDRAASQFALSEGSLAQLGATGELIAPEVSAITFEYWDGVNWLTAWSSDQSNQLPTAVRVTIAMQPQTEDSSAADTEQLFSHVIRLPLARLIDPSQFDQDDASDTQQEGTDS